MLQLIIYLNQKSLVGSTLKKEGGQILYELFVITRMHLFAVAKEVSKMLDDFLPRQYSYK